MITNEPEGKPAGLPLYRGPIWRGMRVVLRGGDAHRVNLGERVRGALVVRAAQVIERIAVLHRRGPSGDDVRIGLGDVVGVLALEPVVEGAVAVQDGDTAETLAARVLEIEHHIYPAALKLVASGGVRIDGDVCITTNVDNVSDTLIVPAAI